MKKILQFPRGTKLTTIQAVLDALIALGSLRPSANTEMRALANGDIAVYASKWGDL